jgi:hypothetical protein
MSWTHSAEKKYKWLMKVWEKDFNMLSHTGEVYQYYTNIHFSPVTMAIIHEIKNNKCLQGCGEKDHSCYWECQKVSCIHFYWEFQQVSLLHSYWNVNKIQSYAVIGKVKEYHSYGNQYGSSSKIKEWKKLKAALPTDPAILLLAWSYINIQGQQLQPTFTRALFTIAKLWN